MSARAIACLVLGLCLPLTRAGAQDAREAAIPNVMVSAGNLLQDCRPAIDLAAQQGFTGLAAEFTGAPVYGGWGFHYILDFRLNQDALLRYAHHFEAYDEKEWASRVAEAVGRAEALPVLRAREDAGAVIPGLPRVPPHACRARCRRAASAYRAALKIRLTSAIIEYGRATTINNDHRGLGQMSDVMTIKQLAEYLQLPVPSLYQMAQAGRLPAAKVGKHWRFQRQVIDEWLRTRSARNQHRILVVDDEDLIRQTFQESLEAIGCQVAVATDGEQALVLAESARFDLIFLDLIMPRKDGVEVLKALRERGCKTHVVLITAYPEGDLIEEALKQGSITLVRKPVAVAAIQATAESLLGLRAAAA